MTRVSVIVPIYNVDSFLEKCIDSIINQTYKDIEIILIDDGSTDNSGDICDKYADKYGNIKTIHQENAGVSEARNLGISVAEGEFIICVDSDDIIERNMIEEMVSCINDDVNVVLCAVDLFNTHYYKERRNRIQSYIKKNGIIDIKEFIASASKSMFQPYFGAPYNKLIRKMFIEKYELKYLEGACLAEDMCFCYEMYSHLTRIGICDKVLYHHRINAGKSLSRKKHTIGEIEIRFKEINNVIDMFCNRQKLNKRYIALFKQQILSFQIALIADCDGIGISDKAHRIEKVCNNSAVKYDALFSSLILKKYYFIYVILYWIRNTIIDMLKRIVYPINHIFKVI